MAPNFWTPNEHTLVVEPINPSVEQLLQISRYMLRNSSLLFSSQVTMFPNCLFHMPRTLEKWVQVILLFLWWKVPEIILWLWISSSLLCQITTVWSTRKRYRMAYVGTPQNSAESVHGPVEAVIGSLSALCQDCAPSKTSSLVTSRNRLALFIKNSCSDFNILQGHKMKTLLNLFF